MDVRAKRTIFIKCSIKKAVKKAAKGIKEIASDIGKAALLAAAGY